MGVIPDTVQESIDKRVSIPTTLSLKQLYEATDRALVDYLKKTKGKKPANSPLHAIARTKLKELCDEVMKEIAADS